MNLTWPSKDPDEVLDFSWPVPLDDGDEIASIIAQEVIAGSISLAPASYAGTLVTVVISGGAPSENAIVKLGVDTSGGRRFVEDFLLKISAAPAVPTDADAIRADIAKLEAAQMDLASGKMVTEVWRSGRRLIYGKVTIEALQKIIDLKQRALDSLTADSQGRRRRRPILLGWPN